MDSQPKGGPRQLSGQESSGRMARLAGHTASAEKLAGGRLLAPDWDWDPYRQVFSS